MIGSGIFIVSAEISRTVISPFWLLMAWVVSGVVTILGALAYGELAAMYPRAGGQYVFLRESMGHLMGFLYGWTLFVVIQTGTIAAVAVAFGKFLGVLWPSITPDRYAWFPQMDFTTRGRSRAARIVAAAADRPHHHLGSDLDQSARRQGRQDRPDDPHRRQDRRPRRADPSRTHYRSSPGSDRRELLQRQLQSGRVHAGLRDRVRLGAGGLSLRERRLEQRDVRGRRGSLAAAESSARPDLRHRTRLPSVPPRQRLVPECASTSRRAEWRDGDGARNPIRHTGPGRQRRRPNDLWRGGCIDHGGRHSHLDLSGATTA